MPFSLTQTQSQPQSSYLIATPMLDFESPDIQVLITQQQWRSLSPYDAIGAV